MDNNSTSQQSKSEQEKGRMITSLLLGIISLAVVYFGIVREYIFGIYIGDYFIYFLFLAFICGVIGLTIGIKTLKQSKIAILGIILSGLGIIVTLLILTFVLYVSQFQ